ncbi:MAG: hypothetical protein Q8R40_02100 [bacterium]|nr:hypothetical protein [bacterium]
MSCMYQGRQWRQNRRSEERLLPEQPHLPAVDPHEEECCGGRCGEVNEDELTTLLRLAICPTPENIVAVYYGDASEVAEKWVDAHMGSCLPCARDMKLVVRSDE